MKNKRDLLKETSDLFNDWKGDLSQPLYRYSWTIPDKPVVSSEEYGGPCPKCGCGKCTMTYYEGYSSTGCLNIVCFQCGYVWEAEPKDVKDKK